MHDVTLPILSRTTLGLAGLALAACEASAPSRTHAAAVASAAEMIAVAAAPSCTKPKAKKLGVDWRSCSGSEEGPCAKYETPESDRCAAESQRSAGVAVDYRYFGQVDCRSSPRSEPVRRVFIHNGHHASGNNDNWKCRVSAAHYTINRDGTIFQHIGEERQAWHVGAENPDSIGIELEIKIKQGKSCNKLGWSSAAAIGKGLGITAGDVIADWCGPSEAQYKSLKLLLDDIRTRHAITDVLGHCEFPGKNRHADPRAFDWRRIGQPIRASVGECDYYGFQAVKTRVTNAVRKADGGTRITLNRGGKSQLEVGDHGWLEDAREQTLVWFVIEKVTDAESIASVPLAPEVVRANLAATVVATPGHTPQPLGAAALAPAP